MTTNLNSSRAQGAFSRDFLKNPFQTGSSTTRSYETKISIEDTAKPRRAGSRSSSRERSPSGHNRGTKTSSSERGHKSRAEKIDDPKNSIQSSFIEDVHSHRKVYGSVSPEGFLKPGETSMLSEMRDVVPNYGIPSKNNEIQTENVKPDVKARTYKSMLPIEIEKSPAVNSSPAFEPRSIFQGFDTSRKGTMTAKELQAVFETFQGKHFSDATCKFVVRLFDLDRAGGLDIKEFEALYSCVKQWVEAFNAYDGGKTGFLSEVEFDYALRKMGINLSKEFIKFLLTKNDPQNRKFSLEQFIMFCVQAQKFTEEFKARDQNYSGNINLRYEDFLELIMRCF